MDETDITLKDLLVGDGEEFAAKAMAVLKLKGDSASLREKLLRLFSQVVWPSVTDVVAKRIEDITDVSLLDLLLAAWKKYQMIEQYGDRTQFPSRQSDLVALQEHSIKSEHHPALEVLVDGQSLAKFVFDISLELELKGFVLRIEDGRIKEIHTGSMQAKGRIAFHGVVLLEKEFHSVQLPGVIRLVGFSLDDPDKVLILTEDHVGHSGVGLLSVSDGKVNPLAYDPASSDDRRMIEHLRGWDRMYGDKSVYFSSRTKSSMAGTVEWTDVFLKQGGNEAVNVSECDEVNCGQPSLSPDGMLVVFVKADH